ncbi:MAG TPA: hypothetical protein VIS07_04720 [Candidatus Binatia bacterium]
MDHASRSFRARATVTLAVSLVALTLACKPPAEVRITSPAHGTFFPPTTSSIVVDGSIHEVDPANVQVSVNGVPAAVDVESKTFRATVPTVAGEVFQPLVAEMTNLSSGKVSRSRVVVVTGDMRPDAFTIANGFGLRVVQSGLDDIAPVAAALIEQQLDLAALLPSSFEDDGATITIVQNPPPSFRGLALVLDANTNRLDVTGIIDDVSVDLRIDKPGIFGGVHCDMQLDIGEVRVTTHQQLSPTSDGSSIAVRQVKVNGKEVTVAFSGLASQVDCSGSGLFEKKKEKRVRDKVQESLTTALERFLVDPDGFGPEDAPIAAAIEEQLAALDIGSVEVPGLRSEIEARFATVDELAVGLQAFLHVDVNPRVIVRPGLPGGVLSLPARPDPDLPGSLLVPSGTPTLHDIVLHDAAFAVSLSAINRLLMSETEARRFALTLDEVKGEPLTAATFAAIPEFAALPPDTPIRVKTKATLAPVVTADPGPHGEILDLQIAHLLVTLAKLVDANGAVREEELLRVAIDARVGVDLLARNGQVEALLGPIDAQSLRLFVVDNPIGTSADLIEAVGPIVLATQIPDLIGTTLSFPLPSFLDLDLKAAAVRRQPGHLVLFTQLVPAT